MSFTTQRNFITVSIARRCAENTHYCFAGLKGMSEDDRVSKNYLLDDPPAGWTSDNEHFKEWSLA